MTAFGNTLSFIPGNARKLNIAMYPTKGEFKCDMPKQEMFNSFQYWREPIPEVSLLDLDLPSLKEKDDESSVSPTFDSFLYWREPVPDLEDFLSFDLVL